MPKLHILLRRLPKLAQELVQSWNLAKILIVLDGIITYLVIKHVRYTEIDWSTYMVQVGQVFNSTKSNFNYTQIQGPTGPLVYPAGHLYIFYLLRELTDGGADIKAAQYIYLFIYLTQLILVYKIYSHKRQMKVSYLLVSNLNFSFHVLLINLSVLIYKPGSTLCLCNYVSRIVSSSFNLRAPSLQ